MPFIQYEDGPLHKYLKISGSKIAVFGRETHCDFQMPLDPLISREHFGIEKDDAGRICVIDLGSTNGTYLNGKKLENEIVPLQEGDIIRAGGQSFVYYEKVPSKKNTQEIFNEISYSIDQGKGFKTMMHEILGNKNSNKRS